MQGNGAAKRILFYHHHHRRACETHRTVFSSRAKRKKQLQRVRQTLKSWFHVCRRKRRSKIDASTQSDPPALFIFEIRGASADRIDQSEVQHVNSQVRYWAFPFWRLLITATRFPFCDVHFQSESWWCKCFCIISTTTRSQRHRQIVELFVKYSEDCIAQSSVLQASSNL